MRKLLWLIILAAFLNGIYYFSGAKQSVSTTVQTQQQKQQKQFNDQEVSYHQTDIYQRTKTTYVVNYLRQQHKLPPYYLTKQQARAQGWDSRQGNLCKVLPGRAIGGDPFSNRERRLPEKHGRKWFEADVNYSCGHRNADRMLWSNDGLIYLTRDHYRSFTPAP